MVLEISVEADRSSKRSKIPYHQGYDKLTMSNLRKVYKVAPPLQLCVLLFNLEKEMN